MAESPDLPTEVQSWIGRKRYEQVGDFDVERGYIWTTCASVQNGNPVYWDDEAAALITGGPIAPPSMISVWFRPHHWAPNRSEPVLPFQLHFDLKQAFELPEGVLSDNTVTFGEPVRLGDRLRTWQVLRSVSAPKKTRLGIGRFWDIDVEYVNQRGEWVGTETCRGFGYRKDG
jgi:acyl dehydratase